MTRAEIEILNKVHGILAKEHATTTWNQVPNKFQLEIAKNLVEGIIITNETPQVRDNK